MLPAGRHPHAYHGRSFCREPKVKLILPGAAYDKKKKGYRVSGVQNIRIEAERYEAFKLHHVHFEIMIYMDKTFFFEDEDSFSPYNYRLDSRKLKNGEHVLTINIADYDRHVGVAAARLIVQN